MMPPDDDISTSVVQEEPEILDSKAILKYKIIKTLVLWEVWFSLGVNTAINTPSLIDLSELMGVNIAQMSLGCFVANSIGMVFGGPISGIVADKNRKHLDLLLALSVGLMCLSTAVVPLVPWFTLAAVLFAFSGFTGAALGATGIPMTLSMWGKKAAAPLQFIHGGYGIGLMITPLFTAPFLSKNITSNMTYFISTAKSLSLDNYKFEFENESLPWTNLTFPKTTSHIYIPYAMTGMLGVVGAIGMIILYCWGAPRGLRVPQRLESRTWRELVQPSTYSPGRPFFGALMVFGLYFMYVGIVGKDRTLHSFITTYAVQKLNESKSTASVMTTAYFASYTLGRYVNMLVALCVPVYISLFVTMISDLGLSLSLVITGLNNPAKFWIFTCLFGFFAGPIYPLGMAWADQYIEVTPVVISVIDLGISTGYMLCTGIGSYLYQHIKKIYIIEIVLYFNIFLVIVVVLLQTLACKYGKRWIDENKNMSPKDSAHLSDGKIDEENQVDECSPLIN